MIPGCCVPHSPHRIRGSIIQNPVVISDDEIDVIIIISDDEEVEKDPIIRNMKKEEDV